MRYFIVLSKEGKFIDTVVKGYINNYLRCIRPGVNINSLEPELVNNSLEPTLQLGYQCGNIFFHDMILSIAEKVAKIAVTKGPQGKYPIVYNGPPFSEPSLTWPIMDDGRLYVEGVPGPFRIVFTMNNKFKCVAIFDGSDLKVCERKSIEGKKNHDTSDYLCSLKRFSHQQLLEDANFGCNKIKISRYEAFPRIYEGPRFEKDAPYYTLPLRKKKYYDYRYTRSDRVVVNSSCEIVGALTTIFKGKVKRFVKCRRLDDNLLPKNFYQNQNEPIHEHPLDEQLKRIPFQSSGLSPYRTG